MSYPIIARAAARTFLQSLDTDTPAEFGPEPGRADVGAEEDWETIGAEVGAKLQSLTPKFVSKDGAVQGAAFEAVAVPIVHQLLPSHPALADPEFWVWLALTHCRVVIEWRYPPNPKEPEKPRDLKNYGVGNAGENLLYRLWLRAELADKSGVQDRYELARCGDVDFWRSHIFRTDYGKVRPFVRALVDFQFPLEKDRKAQLKIAEIRALAKHLKRARTNLMFEVMTESKAAKFIAREWERLASQAS